MKTLRTWFSRFYSLFRKERLERDLLEELASHLELHAADNLRAGMTAEQARRDAIMKLGGVEQTKESYRERRGFPFLERLFQDVPYGLRILAKNPGFSTVAVLSLALGIGANTAIFSLVSSVLLRPLPYREPDRLMWVADYLPKQRDRLVIESDYYAWRSATKIFTDIAAYEPGETLTLTGAGEPERLSVGRATYNFLDVLGVNPKLGRSFREEEDRPGVPHVALLSDKLWRERFSASPGILGQSIRLDGELYTVAGVLPAEFEFLDNSRADVLVPSALENHVMSMQRGMRIVRVVGRLGDGVTPKMAAANLDAVNAKLFAAYPASFGRMFEGAKAEVVPVKERSLGKVRPALLLLLGAVAFVLLIACANIANLQLARGIAREKEMAIRDVLGAAQWRIVVQLLTESGTIAFAGGLCGLLLASNLILIFQRFSQTDIPHMSLARLDVRVLCFTLVIATLSALLFGWAPTMVTLRRTVAVSLKESSAQTGIGRVGRKWQRALVVSELAAAFVLITAAGLFAKSFLRLSSLPVGFDGNGVETARISLPPNLYQTHEQQFLFFQQLNARIAALPGVEASAMASVLPLQGVRFMGGIEVEGRPPELPGQAPPAAMVEVSAGYFETLRIPLIEGRFIRSPDNLNTPREVVVNQAFVRRFFPRESPIENRIRLGREEWWTIEGVVGDSQQEGLAVEVRPAVFVSIGKRASPEMTILLRNQRGRETLLPALRGVVADLDKDLPVYEMQTMEELLKGQTSTQRFNTILLSAFALIAVLLAITGIYGVVAYGVSQRRHEIGLRMTLGAKPRDILQMVFGQAAMLTCFGMLLGMGISLTLARFIGNLLFEVQPTDPMTYAIISGLFLVVVLLACYIPARRAAHVDPMIALRYE